MRPSLEGALRVPGLDSDRARGPCAHWQATVSDPCVVAAAARGTPRARATASIKFAARPRPDLLRRETVFDGC
jgi:hypothetical protein